MKLGGEQVIRLNIFCFSFLGLDAITCLCTGAACQNNTTTCGDASDICSAAEIRDTNSGIVTVHKGLNIIYHL